MKVLVACEFSRIVAEAFERRGHDVTSCDLLPAEKLGNHYQGDIRDILGDAWDMMIAFPPCTHLAVSGARWFKNKAAEQAEALEFIRLLLNAPIPMIALENPIGIISTHIRKPDQIIQPWQFGEDASKSTCLWLKGLPKLKPTRFIEPHYRCPCGSMPFEYELGKYGCPNCLGEKTAKLVFGNQTPSGQNNEPPSPERWKNRSRAFQGVAEAMSIQWSGV